MAKLTEMKEDGLDNDLAAHINSKMAELALSAAEKQVNCADVIGINTFKRLLYHFFILF